MHTHYSESDGERSAVIVGLCLLLAMILVLCCTGMARAQTLVINPTKADFVASSDHSATSTLDGSAVLTSYRLDLYLAGASSPMTSVSLGKPTPVSGHIVVSPAELAAIPVGQRMFARVVAVGPGGEAASADSNPFGRLGPPAGATAVSIAR